MMRDGHEAEWCFSALYGAAQGCKTHKKWFSWFTRRRGRWVRVPLARRR